MHEGSGKHVCVFVSAACWGVDILMSPQHFEEGDKIRSRPHVGELATSPLTCGVCPTFQSKGQNQKWCTCGRMGYITPAVWGVPYAS